MCFSAQASFVASGGLTVLGGATLKIAKKKEKVLALIPLMFAVQQAFEGVQWLYVNRGETSLAMGYGFLLFALIVWPTYVPAFVFTLDKKKRKIIGWFLAAGIFVSLYFAWLIFSEPLEIGRLNSCINYNFHLSYWGAVVPAYLFAVLGSFVFSSITIFRWFGVAIAILAATAWIFYAFAFTSVWCFFAAIVSSMFFIYAKFRKPKGTPVK